MIDMNWSHTIWPANHFEIIKKTITSETGQEFVSYFKYLPSTQTQSCSTGSCESSKHVNINEDTGNRVISVRLKRETFAVQGDEGRTLQYVAKDGRLDIVEWMVSQLVVGSNLQALITALVASCVKGQLAVTQFLWQFIKTLPTGADTLSGAQGGEALFSACYHSRYEVASWIIINTQADVSTSGARGDTPLHSVIWRSHNDSTPLHSAPYSLDRVDLCIGSYEDIVNKQDNDGNTALHWACYYGNRTTVEDLMHAGANEHITNDDGHTPAQVAELRGFDGFLPYLNRISLQCQLVKRKPLMSVLRAVSIISCLSAWRK